MWKDFVEPDEAQMTIWCRCVACWIPTYNRKLYLAYVTFIGFPLRHWLHVCASMLHYTYLPVFFFQNDPFSRTHS
jgi:hypothetical protein